MCLLEGRPVAGLSPKPESWAGPNVWSTYLAVDDADATIPMAASEDGTVVVEPVTVGPMGRMAFGADPAGGVYGVWQAGEHSGVHVYNEPGSLVWNELMTRDYAKVLSFSARSSAISSRRSATARTSPTPRSAARTGTSSPGSGPSTATCRRRCPRTR